MRYRPKTIEEVGLENHLNNTVDDHNGFDFSAFKRMYDANVNLSNLARSFNVDRRTISKWIAVYEKELADEE